MVGDDDADDDGAAADDAAASLAGGGTADETLPPPPPLLSAVMVIVLIVGVVEVGATMGEEDEVEPVDVLSAVTIGAIMEGEEDSGMLTCSGATDADEAVLSTGAAVVELSAVTVVVEIVGDDDDDDDDDDDGEVAATTVGATFTDGAAAISGVVDDAGGVRSMTLGNDVSSGKIVEVGVAAGVVIVGLGVELLDCAARFFSPAGDSRPVPAAAGDSEATVPGAFPFGYEAV